MNESTTLLDIVLEHEAKQPERLYLTQPLDGDRVVDYRWGEVVGQARRMAAHLRSRGLAPGSKVAILSKNCAHFLIADLAILLGGYVSVAIYATETAATVRYVIEHSEAALLFVGKLDLWPQQQAGVPEGLPCIALPLAPPTGFENWDEIVARTPPLAGPLPRAPDEIVMLLYTSGSTGQPKGVMTSLGALTRAACGVASDLRKRLGAEAESRVLSYLPLAHAMERTWIEAASLVDGRTRVFFAESLDTFVQDLRRARPTLFISVPRLWLKFQQGVFAKMAPQRLDRLLGMPFVGRLVARKVLAGLGLDAVVQAGSASAPLPREVLLWYRRLGLSLFEGYAMTEDNAYSHACNEQAAEAGWVGQALPGVQVRIAPDGEILIKSPGAFSGYYKQPEETARAFTDDGFFHTGDLGELRPDGLLRITGRAKEIFKTSKGKYVAPAPIENHLNAHPVVELSLVSGVGQAAPYGLVVLAEDWRARVADADAKAQAQQALEALLREVNAELAEHEKLRMLVVARQPWSIDDGTLTPTMKIRRSRIEAAVEPQLAGWYAQGARVVWA